MANRVRQQGDHWIADFTDPETGKRRQHRVGTEDAAWALIQLRAEEVSVKRAVSKRSGVKEPPVENVAGFTVAQAFNHSMEKRWKGTEAEEVMIIAYKLVREFFGPNTQLVNISGKWFDLFREALLEEGRKKSTVNRYCNVLLGMREDALQRGLISTMPAFPKGLKIDKVAPRFLSTEEVEAFVEQFWRDARNAKAQQDRQDPQQMQDIFRFRISHGTRFGETIRITPRDINFDANMVSLWKTKNGHPRTVPIVGNAKEILKRRSEGLDIDQPIFTFSYCMFKDRFNRAREALGLVGRVTGHTTRHTMAARAITKNISTAQVMHMGGWQSLTSLNHYAHMDTQGLEEIQKALESYEK